jgi:autotransporter-associated beta strand protein
VLQQIGTGTTILTADDGVATTISAGTFQVGNGGTSGSISGSLTDNATLAIDRSDTFTFGIAVSGTGVLQQIGTGTTIITATESYGGGTTISAGTLQIGNGGTAGSITGNVTDNGTLAIDRSDTFTFGNAVSGTGAFQQIGTGTTIITATERYSGGTTISAGTLQVGNGGTAGKITGDVIDNGTLAIDRSNTYVVVGSISGTGAFQQIGTGTTILIDTDGAATTTIKAGTLEVLDGGGSITHNVIFAGNAATLRLDESVDQLGGIIAGAVSGDNIDLAFHTFAAGDHATWQQNGANGTLSLLDGSNAALASLTLAGTFTTANFMALTDNHGGTLIEVVTPPTITGAVAGQTITDKQTDSPFSGVTIGDPDVGQTETLTVTLDNATKGALSNLGGGSYNGATGVYSVSGTAAAVTAALDGLVFTPTANHVAPGSTETTTFTIAVNDGVASTVTDASTTVVTTSVNDAPTLGGDDAIALAQGGTVTVTTADLTATDPDNTDAQLVYTVTATSHGAVLLNGSALTNGQTFTQADVAASRVSFHHDGSQTTAGSFSVSLTDGVAAPQTATVNATVTLVNHPPNDFNGDGKSDILWQNASTGGTSEWLMAGGIASVPGTPAGPGWSAVATGDFNGDGTTDLMWQNASTGETNEWLMSASGGIASVPATPPGLGWSAVAAGDFNGDGTTDLMWQNTSTGGTSEWLMSPSGGIANAPATPPGLGWHVAAVGDFNGDGTTDLMWQNASTGATSEWLMAGGIASVPGTPPALGWSVVATGDFNGDGKTDLMWQNASTGATSEWLMSGGIFNTPETPPGPGWTMVAAGDFNGDGTTDLMWQNASSGATSEWLMSKTGGIASVPGTPPGLGWTVVAAGDFNGDGTKDLMWQNASTGETSEWLMSGGIASVPVTPAGLGWTVAAIGDFDGDGSEWLMSTSGGIASFPATPSGPGWHVVGSSDLGTMTHHDGLFG